MKFLVEAHRRSLFHLVAMNLPALVAALAQHDFVELSTLAITIHA